jgi:hypothetical protein
MCMQVDCSCVRLVNVFTMASPIDVTNVNCASSTFNAV